MLSNGLKCIISQILFFIFFGLLLFSAEYLDSYDDGFSDYIIAFGLPVIGIIIGFILISYGVRKIENGVKEKWTDVIGLLSIICSVAILMWGIGILNFIYIYSSQSGLGMILRSIPLLLSIVIAILFGIKRIKKQNYLSGLLLITPSILFIVLITFIIVRSWPDFDIPV